MTSDRGCPSPHRRIRTHRTPERKPLLAGERRTYLRKYLRWLWPHRVAIAGVFLLAVVSTSLEMIEPLFMRYIVDRVLLNDALDTPGRMARLQIAGVIAHRLSTIRRAHLILAMAEGRVIERGTHEEASKRGTGLNYSWRLNN